jgi:integrase
LALDALDIDGRSLRVVRVVEEVNGVLRLKPYPKSESGRRTVPVPQLALDVLVEHRALVPSTRWQGVDLVSSTLSGTPVSRSVFRARVWRPALVRAGLLGAVEARGDGRVCASWTSEAGEDVSRLHDRESEAVAEVARYAAGGLRFHDLRHAYATWLISDGVPVNVVQRVMGHASASTTLNLYVHPSRDHDDAVRGPALSVC